MNDYSFRIGDIEFKFSDGNKQWELCAWIKSDSKIQIASFKPHSEGYDMITVSDRFFKYNGFDAGKIAMKFLMAKHDIDESLEEIGGTY